MHFKLVNIYLDLCHSDWIVSQVLKCWVTFLEWFWKKWIVKWNWLSNGLHFNSRKNVRDKWETRSKPWINEGKWGAHPSYIHFFKVFASFCGLEVGFENGCKRMLPKPWKNVGKWGAHTFYIHFLEVFASFGGLEVGFENGCRMDVKWMWAPGFWRTCWKMDVFRCGLQTCWKTMCFQVSVHTLCKPLVNWLDILWCTEIEEHEVTWLPDAVKSLEKLALGKNKSNHSLYVVAGAIGVKLLCSTSRKFTGHISVCFFSSWAMFLVHCISLHWFGKIALVNRIGW